MELTATMIGNAFEDLTLGTPPCVTGFDHVADFEAYPGHELEALRREIATEHARRCGGAALDLVNTTADQSTNCPSTGEVSSGQSISVVDVMAQRQSIGVSVA